MENEKFQELVLQQLQTLVGGQQRLESRIDRLESKTDKLGLRVENEIIDKIGALFDGYNLRGNQIDKLQKHLDERMDSVETDTRYLVARVAKLEKLAK